MIHTVLFIDAQLEHLIGQLNPEDDDMKSESQLIIDRVDELIAYVESHPCTCTPAAADYDDDPRGRCRALNRRCDTPEER